MIKTTSTWYTFREGTPRANQPVLLLDKFGKIEISSWYADTGKGLLFENGKYSNDQYSMWSPLPKI